MTEAGYRVRGRVQGVGFRWWTHTQATRLGLEGTVRNCADGAVEVTLRGPEDAVAEMRRRLASGPPGARVDEVADVTPAGAGTRPGFHIVK
jgi:acylphosphatase